MCCICTYIIPKDERKKLESKSRKCLLLSYGTETKGYRLYDSSRERVFFSRDVLFNELNNGVEKETGESKEKRGVELSDCIDHEEENCQRT